jgi:hypothetical protein
MTTRPRAWRHLALGGVLLAACSAPCRAAAISPGQEDKIAIFVSHNGKDAVGALFADELKGALKRSSSASPSEAAADADVALFLTTLDPDAVAPGRLATVAWSLVIVKEVKVYVGSGLRLCDRERARQSAGELAAQVEQLLNGRRSEVPGSAERKRYESEWNREVEAVADTLPEDSCGIKSRTAFREQLGTYLTLSTLANMKLDVHDVIKSVAANFTIEGEFGARMQAQASKLAQCQAELAVLKKTAGAPAIKK